MSRLRSFPCLWLSSPSFSLTHVYERQWSEITLRAASTHSAHLCLHVSLALFKPFVCAYLLHHIMLSFTSFTAPLFLRFFSCAVCACRAMRAQWEPGGIKSSQGFAAVVLVGSQFPLSRDQMGLGRSGTRPRALDNTASAAMCEHLFSSIKTVIWIFKSHCLMTALSHACMKSK